MAMEARQHSGLKEKKERQEEETSTLSSVLFDLLDDALDTLREFAHQVGACKRIGVYFITRHVIGVLVNISISFIFPTFSCKLKTAI